MRSGHSVWLLALACAALLVACGANNAGSGGVPDASEVDAGSLDASGSSETGIDAGALDGASPVDGGGDVAPNDAAPADASSDTGANDASTADAATVDAGDAAVAVGPAALSISDGPTFDYGSILDGNRADHTFTVTNSGAVNATSLAASALSAPFSFKGGGYPGTGGTCSSLLAGSSATCTVVLTFTPSAATFAQSTLTLSYFDGAATQSASRAIQGTGEAPAAISISDGPAFDYGTVVDGASADHTFTLTNSGGAGATSLTPSAFAAPFQFKGGTYPGTGGTCGGSLASSASCTVVVTFAPTTASLATGSLALTYSDGVAAATAPRALQGTGIPPAVVAISDGATFNYGDDVVGTINDHTFTLTNSGSAVATALAAGALGAPFSFKGGAYPGTGGTCATSLVPSTSCTVLVTFAPTALGPASATLAIGYGNGAVSQNATRPMQGNGVSPGLVTISDGATFDYGGVVIGTSVDHTFTLTNTGAATATALAPVSLSAPFSYKGIAYPGTGGTCSTSLAGGNATCTVVVTFTPTSPALATGTLSLGYYNGAGSQTTTRPIQGTGLTPAVLTISDGPTFDYLGVVDGKVADHVFTVSNGAGATATSIAATALSAPFSFKAGTYPGTGGTCGAALLGSATCTIVVTFAPTTPGLATSALSVGYFDGTQNQGVSRPIQGTGVGPAQLAISNGPTFDYGSVVEGTSADHTFTVTNTGGATATALSATPLSLPLSFKGGAYPGASGTCGGSLAGSSATCTIVVTFAPTSPGLIVGALSIGYFDGASSQGVARPILGTGIAPASLAISDGPTFDFGPDVDGSHNDHTFTVMNVGTGTATALSSTPLLSPFSFKGGSYPGTGGTCGASLAGSNGTCAIVVTFSPTSPGLVTSALALAYFDGANNQSASRPLQGTGVSPAVLAISDGPTFNYGNDVDGTNNDHALTVTNTGPTTATSLSPTPLSAPYSFKGGSFPGAGGTCGASLAGSNATCTIVVTFSPTSPGLASSALALAYFDGANNQSVSRPIQGTGVSPAVLTISDGATFDYRGDVDGTHNDHTFTVTNTGSPTATSLSAAALVAPFAFKGSVYPGTGGTCGAALAGSNATCTIVVTFSPTSPGLATSALSIAYFNGAINQNVTRPMQGTGVSPAVLAFSEGGSYAFGTIGVGQTSEHVFRVTNNGGATATSIAPASLVAPFAFKGGTYPGFGGTCGASLPSGVSCAMIGDYVAVSGPSSGSLSLAYNDGAQTQSVAVTLSGTGTNAALLRFTDLPPFAYGTYGVPADPATFDFGAHGVGSSSEQTFFVTNNGAATATALAPGALGAPFSFKGGTFPGVGGGCGATLAATATCTIVVTFAPTGSASPNLATVSLGYNDGTGAQTANRSISGEVTANAVLVVEDYKGVSIGPSYDFGQQGVGTTASHPFFVLNQGAVTATAMTAGAASLPFAFAGGSYPGTGGNCSATLAVGAGCMVVGSFSPTTAGPASGSLAIAYNDGASTQSATRAVRGTGITTALLAIYDNESPSIAYDFGTLPVNKPADATFTVVNGGAVAATSIAGGALAAPFSYKGSGYPGTGGTCASSLASAASCTVVVTFLPTVNGAKTASLSLGYSDGTTPQTAQRALTGTGTAQALLQISDWQGGNNGGGFGSQYQPYDFGTWGIPADHTFYVTNSGAQTATSMSGAAQTGPTFQIKGGTYPGTGGTCGTSLAAGASCSVVVTFTPGASATNQGTLSIGYNDGGATQSATRALAGEATVNALLLVVDGPGQTQGNSNPYNYGTTGTPEYHIFYVVNDGAQAATSIANGATLGSGFAFTGGTYPGTGGTCGTSLASSANCSISVTFTPSGSTSASSTITLDYFDGSATQAATRAVTGTGTTLAVLQVYPAGGGGGGNGYDFGTWGVPRSQMFNVFNSGAQSATSMGDGHNLGAPFAFTGGAYPGTGGTCGATLAPNASCSIAVTFTPAGSGPASSTIGVAYSDGNVNQDATLKVSGTSTALALVTVTGYFGFSGSNPPPYDYGTTGQPEDHTFTVMNSGAQTATALGDGGSLGGGFAFKGGSYPGIGGTCGTSLASGANCPIVVTFTPTGSGPRSSTITLNYNDGASGQKATVGVTGTATTAAILTVSDWPGGGGGGSGFNYGTWGVPVSHTFYVTNAGAQAATQMGDAGTLSNGFAFTGGAYPGTGGTCGSSLATSTSCSVVVTFTPSAAGPTGSTIGITYNDGTTGQVAQRQVSGTSTANALVQIFDYQGQQSPSFNAYNYGTAGTPTQATFYVTNTGAKTATTLGDGGTLGSGFGYTGTGYPGTGGTCGGTLASGASCTIVVTFTPTGNGPRSSTITLAYNDGSGPQTATRALTGTSTTAALLVFQGQGNGPPNPVDFGTSGVPVTQTLNVTNLGAALASAMGDGGTLSGMFSFAGGAYPGTGGTCGATLPSGATCSVVMTFKPTGNGPASSTVTIAYNDGASGRSLSRPVTGTATSNALLIVGNYAGQTQPSQQPFDFGTWGVQTTRTFYLINVGAKAATAVADGGTLGGDFSYAGTTGFPGTAGTCTATIASGTSCTIVIVFKPTGNGPTSSTLTALYNDGASAQAATLGVQGTATTFALLVIDDFNGMNNGGGPASYFFGTWGIANQHTFYVFNNGAQQATAMTDGVTLGNDFAFAGGYPGTGGSCVATLASNASCMLVVTFTPVGTGPRSSTITLDYNDGAKAQATTNNLSGTATSRAYLIVSENGGGPSCGDACGPFNVGSVAAGGTITHTFTVFNEGAASTTSMGDGGGLGAPFVYGGGTGFPGTAGTCGNVLAAGATCSIVVDFKPVVAGTFTSDLAITFGDGLGAALGAGRKLMGTGQ